MFSERNLDRRVLQELVNYFFSLGAEDLNIAVSMAGGGVRATVRGHIRHPESVDLEALNRDLNKGRMAEVEGYYAQLIGIDQTDNDFALLCDLIDRGQAEWVDGALQIAVVRLP